MVREIKKSAKEKRKELRKEQVSKKITKAKLKVKIEQNPEGPRDRPYKFVGSEGTDYTPLPLISDYFTQVTASEAERLKSISIGAILSDLPLQLRDRGGFAIFSKGSSIVSSFSSLYSGSVKLASLKSAGTAPSLIEMLRRRTRWGAVLPIDSWKVPEAHRKVLLKGRPYDNIAEDEDDGIDDGFTFLSDSDSEIQVKPVEEEKEVGIESSKRDVGELSPGKQRAPSMFRLREDPPSRYRPIQRTFSIILFETENIELYAVESKTAYRGTTEADNFLADADRYQNSLKINKTLINATTQTINMANTTESTVTDKFERSNSACLATISDIYDSMKELEVEIVVKENTEEKLGQVEQIRAEFALDTETESELSETEEPEPDRIFVGKDFTFKFMALERAVANNNAGTRQGLYQDRCIPDPMGRPVPFKYKLAHLWTYRSIKCYGKAVTSFSYSSVSKGMLAVSYGAFRYKDSMTGLICLWNVKNPYYPERSYHFDCGVTYVEFSTQHPHILGAAFAEGFVSVMDVSHKSLRVICNNRGTKMFAYQPVWQIRWFVSEDGDEIPVSCSDNGRVSLYRKDTTFAATTLLCAPKREGVLKGARLLKKKYRNEIPVAKRPAVLCLAPHPTDPTIYLAGTDDGTVHKCSINYLHEHLDAFAAHNGPVYNIQFHPASDKIFMTCGADYLIRIWGYGIEKPIIELTCGKYPIEHAAWSPANPIVIVSVGALMIDIWDIRRKITEPVSRIKTRLNCRLTRICFSNSGHNIYVGDIMGNVQVFALEYMPFDPIFKEEALADAIKKSLTKQYDVLQLLKELGHPFD